MIRDYAIGINYTMGSNQYSLGDAMIFFVQTLQNGSNTTYYDDNMSHFSYEIVENDGCIALSKESSNSYAKIKVTFKKAGTVTITATSTDRGKVKATVKLKLLPEATSIVIKNGNGTIITGKTITSKTVNYQLKAAAKPTNAEQTVTWKSSNTKIATVDKNGKVKAKKKGTCTITCTAKDGSGKKATCKITVK